MTDQFHGPGSPTPNYNVVKAINADAKIFGKVLLKTKHRGVIRKPASSFSFAPSADLPITAMDDDLLVGAFTSANGSSYLMIVDTRTEIQNKTAPAETLPARSSRITLNAACGGGGAAFVGGGAGGFERLHASAHGVAGNVASVRLKAGGGAMLRLTGEGCAAAVSNVRQWRFDPRTLSTKGGQELQDLGGKQSTYSRFGAGRRHYAPGGPAGWESNYILGGSYWETGGLKTETEAIAFTQAGFSVASINEAGLKSALGYAAAYGNFVFATTQTPDNKSQVMSPSDALSIGDSYSCHTNLLGMVVADSGAAALASAAATTGALKEFNWMFPLVPSVESVAQAQVRKTPSLPRSWANFSLL